MSDRWTVTRLGGVALAVVAIGATVFGLRVVASNGDGEPATTPDLSVEMPQDPALEAEYGIRIRRVSVIGEGGMVELRYQLLDADRAAVIHADDQDYTDDFPRIEAGNATLSFPTFHHHGGDLVTGREFSILYPNADSAVRAGQTVTVAIGDHRLDDVPVD